MGQQCIGVLGGMGPLATADFFQKLVTNTMATGDEDHLPIVIHNDPTIPSRRDAILGDGSSPVKALADGISKLEQHGAEILAMPCNTAHYFYPQLQPRCAIPFLHMPKEAVFLLKRSKLTRVCLLATTMTLQAEVYDDLFISAGIEMFIPSKGSQEEMMDNIFYGIKQGKTDVSSMKFERELEQMHKSMGVEVFLLACTELPLLFQQKGIKLPVLDATLALARLAIRTAGGVLTPPPNELYI